MRTTPGRTLILLAILALPLAAAAQHPLVGAWQETEIGFRVIFEQQADGRLTGVLQGQAAPLPLNIVSDQRNAQGTFFLDGEVHGFAAQLQPDDTTLLIWLFQVDATGQPQQGSYEQYQAHRIQTPPAGGGVPYPPAPPDANQPGMPGGGGGLPQPAAPPQQAMPGPLGQQQGDITGTWRTEDQFDDGTPFTIELKLDASGTWRVDFVAEGQPLAYFGGPYTFSQDGVLQYQETSRSPQVCFRGQCQDNLMADSSGADQVYFQDADTIVATDTQSGEQTVYRRSAAAGGSSQVPGFGVPSAVPPMAPPAGDGFPPPPAGGGFPPMPPTGGGFPPPPAGGGFPPVPPAGGGFPPVPGANPLGGGAPTAPVSASNLTGVWQAEQKIDASLTFTVFSTFGANGSWRHDFSQDGKPVALYEGTFTVSPEGMVLLQVTNHSPQMCVRGSCQPAKPEDIIRTFRVTFQTPDTFTTSGKNSRGEEVRLAYRRAGPAGM